MSVEDTKKAELARESRVHESMRERPKARPKETDFDQLLERSKTAQQLLPQKQQAAKTATDEAIREAVRHQEKGEGRRREDDEKKEGREGRQRSEGSESRGGDQRVTAKGKAKEDGGGGGGREGQGQPGGRRELSKSLVRHGAKSIPVDLSNRFAGRLAQTMKGSQAQSPALTQHILNKLVQFVRIGINRKGEKEMQVELSERIFRGLKLRVIARGGKVAVHLKTADARGKKAIEEGEQAIRDALAKKGIDVDEIVIS